MLALMNGLTRREPVIGNHQDCIDKTHHIQYLETLGAK